MKCAHSRVEASLDRWRECHWHIHQIERTYHEPDSFRYSLNSFIRAVKEVPQLLQMELQHEPMYRQTIKPMVTALYRDPLLSLLHKKRDFLVHQGMLVPHSSGYAGVTRGHGKLKMGMTFGVGPHESSDEAFIRYVKTCKAVPDFNLLCGPEEDTLPCIQRKWVIAEFPETDLLDVVVAAWQTTGEVMSQVLVHLGAQALDLTMPCRHDPEKVRMKIYTHEQFETQLKSIR